MSYARKTTREDPDELQIEHTTIQLASGEYDLRYFKTTGLYRLTCMPISVAILICRLISWTTLSGNLLATA